ncbi:Phenolic glucoside malonyltransferase 2 [Linum perenne]
MASTAAVKVIDVLKVTPQPPPSAPFSLPLTFFDTTWIAFPPVERIFLYQFPHLSPDLFRSQLLPKLRRSLSLTLHNFLPLAGSITWPSDPDAVLPIILYTPGDEVFLTVAESTEDFDHISGDGIREASDTLAYVPELLVSDSAAAILSLQITLFPNRGFWIGVSAHHGIFDGKTQAMFMKAWAHTCRQIGDEEIELELKALAPVFDRSRFANSDDIALEYWNNWFQFRMNLPGMHPNPNPRSLELLWGIVDSKSKRLRVTFNFSRERINNLKKALTPKVANPNYLSSFVITLAHTAVCIVKAKKEMRGEATIQLAITADFRSRLDPPAEENFFGNCVSPFEVVLRAADAVSDGGGGTAYAAGKIIETVKVLEKGVMAGAKERLANFLFTGKSELAIGVAGSPRLGMYGVDFGYGRPTKVEITSTARTGAISMAESKDGSGGVEVGVVLKPEEMDAFCAAFNGGEGE